MRGSSRIAWAIIVAFLTSSCAYDVANRYYGSRRYAATDPDHVEILYRAPSRPYEVIADFQSRGESPKSMKKRAAEIGADAIIITPLGGYYKRSEEWADQDDMSDTYTRLIGAVIKYKP